MTTYAFPSSIIPSDSTSASIPSNTPFTNERLEEVIASIMVFWISLPGRTAKSAPPVSTLSKDRFGIEVLVILIRVVNPAYPEGMMLAILFMNMFAPLIDHFIVQGNINRRLARNAI